MRSEHGSDGLVALDETEFGVKRLGRIVLRTDNHERDVASRTHCLGERRRQTQSETFPTELGPSLHREHGSVVRLHLYLKNQRDSLQTNLFIYLFIF